MERADRWAFPTRRGRGAGVLSRLNAAILRISDSLDLDTVLREIIDGARALTGARYGMVASGGGDIEAFFALGLSDNEHRHVEAWPHGRQFFEHLRNLPDPLRLADAPAYTRELGYAAELSLSKTLQATPMRHRGVPVGSFFPGEALGGSAGEGTCCRGRLVFAKERRITLR